jgi:hypothetical protein
LITFVSLDGQLLAYSFLRAQAKRHLTTYKYTSRNFCETIHLCTFERVPDMLCVDTTLAMSGFDDAGFLFKLHIEESRL